MRLVCLECSAAYEAPDNLFGPQPREVRCNRCGFQWTVVGSQAEADSAPAGLSIGPAGEPRLAPAPPRPRPAPPFRAEPLAAPPPPPQAPPMPGSARLADTLAGPLMPSETQAANEVPRPVLVVEPAAESTRSLLSSGAKDEAHVAPPDPEEKRLSHELDFGAAERQRPKSTGGGTRRVVVVLLLLIILAGIAAVVFKTQIIAAVPALKPSYTQLGL